MAEEGAVRKSELKEAEAPKNREPENAAAAAAAACEAASKKRPSSESAPPCKTSKKSLEGSRAVVLVLAIEEDGGSSFYAKFRRDALTDAQLDKFYEVNGGYLFGEKEGDDLTGALLLLRRALVEDGGSIAKVYSVTDGDRVISEGEHASDIISVCLYD